MNTDAWLALASLLWSVAVVIGGGTWRAFNRIERRLDALDHKARDTNNVLGWQDNRITNLERKSA